MDLMLDYLFARPPLFILLLVVLARLVLWVISPPHWQDFEDSRGGQYNYKFMSWW